uniref:Uncharacterized protein n=1 Tax=Daphnia galeata TaxID=27404 RepID=A0A8J2RLP2_9CRUS|nr:unnamed protein product [Daphnia galeata]
MLGSPRTSLRDQFWKTAYKIGPIFHPENDSGPTLIQGCMLPGAALPQEN